MSENEKILKLKILIQASTQEVYDSLTNPVALSDWFCNISHATPQEGGGIYLWWVNQSYVSGEFVELKPGKKIVFTWHGNDEPGRSQVEILLKSKTDHVNVHVIHSGLGKGKVWRPYRKQIKKIWKRGLENLKSTLETGQDLRLIKELNDQGWEIPSLPGTLDDTAEYLLRVYDRVDEYISSFSQGSTSTNPAWSTDFYTQAITHERRLHTWMEELIEGQDPTFLDDVNHSIQSNATAVSFPTPADLQKELRHNQNETTAMILNIPSEIYHHKRKFWLLRLKVFIHAAALENKIKQLSGSIPSTAENVCRKETKS